MKKYTRYLKPQPVTTIDTKTGERITKVVKVQCFDSIEQLIQLSQEDPDDIDWRRISWAMDLPEWFIDKFYDRLDWLAITECQQLTPFLLEKYPHRVWWAWLNPDVKIPESTLRKISSHVTSWEAIIRNSNLSDEFVAELTLKGYI